jgi:hypothetical protein
MISDGRSRMVSSNTDFGMTSSTPNDDSRPDILMSLAPRVYMGVFVLAEVLRCSFVAEVYGQWKVLPADSAA